MVLKEFQSTVSMRNLVLILSSHLRIPKKSVSHIRVLVVFLSVLQLDLRFPTTLLWFETAIPAEVSRTSGLNNFSVGFPLE
jgi:hypothetical protein